MKLSSFVVRVVAVALTVTATLIPAPLAQEEDAPMEIVNPSPARQPVNISTFDHCSTNGLACGFNVYTVPVDKRLVIEYVSMIIGDVTQPDTVGPRIRTTVGGVSADHELGVTSQITQLCGFSNIVFSRNVRLYADPGTVVQASFRREKAISQFAYGLGVTISGYLEPAP